MSCLYQHLRPVRFIGHVLIYSAGLLQNERLALARIGLVEDRVLCENGVRYSTPKYAELDGGDSLCNEWLIDDQPRD